MSGPRRLVIATTNPGKRREIEQILKDCGDERFPECASLCDFEPLPPPQEDGDSFAENARIKALYYAAHLGERVLADDSGLCVDALLGAPGVASARWAPGDDTDRCRLLLDRLLETGAPHRSAQFVCAVAVATPDGALVEAEGRCAGEIAPAPIGDNGFGYDSIFIACGTTRTMAQLSPAEKDQLSHRAAAIRALFRPAFLL